MKYTVEELRVMNPKDLKIRLGNLMTEIDGMKLKKDLEERDFTPEEIKKVESRLAEQDVILGLIKNDNPSGGVPSHALGAGGEIDLGTGGGGLSALPKPGWRGYKNHFPTREANPFESFRDFATAVASRADKRLVYVNDERRATGMTGATPAQGGFLMPTEYSAAVFDVALENTVLFKRTRIETMTAATKKIPGFKIGNHSVNLFGGVTFSWTNDGSPISGSKPTLRIITLTAHGLKGLCYTTNELRLDAPDFDERLSLMLGQAAGWYLDDALINGDGAGKPMGILNAACKIEVSKVALQTADTIKSENIDSMEARLAPGCWDDAIFLANPTTLPQLKALCRVVGTGGNTLAYLQRTASGWSLDGFPLFFSEKMPIVGDAGDLTLLSPSQIATGLVGTFQVAISEHIAFDSDESAWRVVVRADSTPLWDTALTPKNGDSLSSIVTIEARA